MYDIVFVLWISWASPTDVGFWSGGGPPFKTLQECQDFTNEMKSARSSLSWPFSHDYWPFLHNNGEIDSRYYCSPVTWPELKTLYKNIDSSNRKIRYHWTTIERK